MTLAVVSGCGNGNGPPPPQASRLYVLHTIRGGPSLTVFVDGAKGSTLAFGDLSRPVFLSPGQHDLVLVPPPPDTTHSLIVLFNAAEGVDYSVFAIDSTSGATHTIEPVFVLDTGAVPPTGHGRLRIAGFAPGAPPIDVYRTQPDSTGLLVSARPLNFRAVTRYFDGAPGGWSGTGTSGPRGRRELPHDLSRGFDARDAADALPRLPVVSRRRSREMAALQPPRRVERVQRAHEMLGPAVPQQPARNGAGLRAHALHVGGADHGERHARDALGEHDVVFLGLDDRALVVGMGRALGGGDEAGAELRARVAHPERRDEPGGVADPAGAHQGNAQVAELTHQLFGAFRSRMTAGAAVHRDEAARARVEPLERPLPLGDVVVHHAADLSDAIDHPARLAERRDEEPHARFDCRVHPALHALEVQPGRLLDQNGRASCRERV